MFAKPKKASTVIILRETDDRLNTFQVLMVKRHPNNKFVPSAYVFPGGSMDFEDTLPDIEQVCSGMDTKKAQYLLQDNGAKNPLASWITGIRETFEETGILFAYTTDNSLLTIQDESEKKKYNSYRKMIYEKKMTFKDFIEQEGLSLSVDRIHYFSHWVTPKFSTIRYDTRFFLAQAPEHQPVTHDGHELTKHIWITPQEALQKNQEGHFKMVFPTIQTLLTLTQYKSIEEALSSAQKISLQNCS